MIAASRMHAMHRSADTGSECNLGEPCAQPMVRARGGAVRDLATGANRERERERENREKKKKRKEKKKNSGGAVGVGEGREMERKIEKGSGAE